MFAKMIVSIAFYLFYWLCCFLGTSTDRKNLAGLRSCPDAVQQSVREHPVLGKSAPQAKFIASNLLRNLLLFTVVFSILGFALKNILGLDGFERLPFGSSLHWAKGWDCLTLQLLTCCGGGTQSASVFPSCRRNDTIKTQASTSARSCEVSRCLRWWLCYILEL